MINNTSGVVKSHLKIGNVYKQQGEYYTKGTRAKELADNNDLADLHADALEQLGDIQMSLGGYSLAKSILNALMLVKELSDNLRESSLLNNGIGTLTVFMNGHLVLYKSIFLRRLASTLNKGSTRKRFSIMNVLYR